MATPKKNTAYSAMVALSSPSTPGKFAIDPAIVAGDFQVSIDGGAFANLTNLPTANPSSSKSIQIDLTADEMNGDKIVVLGSDPDDTWDDVYMFIDVPESNEEDQVVIRKLLQNKQVVNKATRQMEVYDDTGTVVEFAGDIFKDNNLTPWEGDGPIIKRHKLDDV